MDGWHCYPPTHSFDEKLHCLTFYVQRTATYAKENVESRPRIMYNVKL